MGTFADVIGLLQDRGLRVRRTGADRLEVVGDGDLDDDLAKIVRLHRDDFLRLLPSPEAQAREIWDDVIKQAGHLLSGNWFGTAEQWAELATIEGRFTAATGHGDTIAMQKSAADYIGMCKRFRMLEDEMQWAETPPVPSSVLSACPYAHQPFWVSAEGRQLVCGVCHPPAREGLVDRWVQYCNRCWFDTEVGYPLCSYCRGGPFG